MITFLRPAGPMPAISAGAILGCGSYFLWPYEPSLAIAPILSMLGFISLFFLSRFTNHHAALFTLFFGLFWGWAQLSTHIKEHTLLPAELEQQRLWVVGQIVEKQENDRHDRVLLQNAKIYAGENQKLPTTVRLSTQRGRFADHDIGSWVATQAKLFSAGEPQFEGDYDPRWQAWQKGYEASGLVMGTIYETQGHAAKPFSLLLNTYRQALATMLNPEKTSSGAMAAALITGLKEGIPEQVQQNFRDAGLAHLLAISGMHLAMVAGLIFFLSRQLMAFFNLAARYDIKKIAAIIGLFAAFAYMLTAGATIPTVRAFIMLGLLFAAMLLNRTRLSVRVLCVAVVIVLGLWPHSVLSASFQMSFVAALALIYWGYHHEAERRTHIQVIKSFDYFRQIWAASVVAGLATLPLAAAHFQHVSFVGFFLNIIAIPLLGVLILPTALLALVTGGFAPVLWVLHQQIGWLVDLASFGAGYDAAGVYVVQWQVLAVFSALAIFLYCKKVWIGFWLSACLIVGVVFWLPHKAPFDIAWFNNGNTVVLQQNGVLYPLQTVGDYTEKSLLRRLLNTFNLTEGIYKNCDASGCFVEINTHKITLLKDVPPTQEECDLSTLVIGVYAPAAQCGAAFIKPKGTAFLKIHAHKIDVKEYAAWQARPWHKR